MHEELASKCCLDNGRMVIEPIELFKYLLLKSIYSLSGPELVEWAKFDLSFKYFLGIAPESDVINSSTLTKFRTWRLKDGQLLDLLISKIVQTALDNDLLLWYWKVPTLSEERRVLQARSEKQIL